MNIDLKLLETEFFLLAMENSVSSDFYLRLSIVKDIFDLYEPSLVYCIKPEGRIISTQRVEVL